MVDPVQEHAAPIPFKAETRQLLDILVHSLYTDREIFLRELISNASDALTRMDFELLTNREVLDPDAQLAIWILPDKDAKTLTIRDTGIGMTSAELIENLGVIAHSGARAFVQAVQEKKAEGTRKPSDIIGQFGVGFYSAFMVAEEIRVVSRSFHQGAEAAAWFSTGGETYTIEAVQKPARGTEVILKLKEDAAEFLQIYRLKEIVRKHSDFIPFPIYIGEDQEQVNRQTALWRQNPREVDEKAYHEFYRSLTLDTAEPLAHAHLVVDAPVQMYAILYAPAEPERGLFSLRREDGLKLYARKVLIQDYSKDLLPEYFRFIQGLVDSEDLPLNVARESIQSSRVIVNLKKVVTGKVIDMLGKLAADKPEQYLKFWVGFGRFIKEGIAVEVDHPEKLYDLLRFRTTTKPEEWSSLKEYLERMPPGQTDIYYLLGDDPRSVLHSPHLDAVRRYNYEVLLCTEPIDPFMLVRLTQFGDHPLVNIATGEVKPIELAENAGAQGEQPQEADLAGVDKSQWVNLVERFKAQLSERVEQVRITDRLHASPARLVDVEGAPSQELQRVYRLLDQKFDQPKKVLEINPRHPILIGLNDLPGEHPLAGPVIEQIYEDALLAEGLHVDPAGMIPRIQKIMELALQRKGE